MHNIPLSDKRLRSILDKLTGEEYERAVLTGAMRLIGENKA